MTNAITISLCMIVKNEEDVIERCLKSVADLVDEIIIVDTGSTDKTKEIASLFTDKVYDYEWKDDFAAARNYSFSLANSMYCMWFDADDVMLEPDREAFKTLKSHLDPKINAIMMKYNTGTDDKGNVTFSYYRERIIKNDIGMKWVGAVHEVIEVIGEKQYSECAVTHKKLHPSDPNRNLRIFEKLINEGVTLDPRQQFYYARELYYHKRFEDAIEVFTSFLDENLGWVENKIDACRHCAYCCNELNRSDDALLVLLRSFTFDSPRAEVCCDIGYHFFTREQYIQAIYWYHRAIDCERTDGSGGFVTLDAYGYTPNIQLCVCFSRIGMQEKAAMYNEKAGEFKPDSEAVAKNRIYFATLNTTAN